MSYNTEDDIEQNVNLSFGTEYDIENNVVIKANENEESVTLKINDLYVKDDNNGNVELISELSMSDDYLYKDYDGHIHNGFLQDTFDSETSKFTIHKELFVNSEEDMAELSCGYIIVRFCQPDIENNIGLSSDSYKFKVDFDNELATYTEHFIMNETESFVIEPVSYDYIETDRRGNKTEKTGFASYMLRTFAYDKHGTRHYSREAFAVYDTVSEKFVLLTPGIENIDNVDSNDDSIKFSFSGLTADATDVNNQPKLFVYVPYDAMNCKIYVNSQKLSDKMSYRNSWVKVSSYTESTSTQTSSTGAEIIMKSFEMSITVQNNLPEVYSEIDNIADYIASPGESNVIDGCSLFNSILNNEDLSTASRYLNITVVYTNAGKEYRSHYKIEQPGYTEKRTIPEFDIKINKDLTLMESANRMSNGVLCNEYQFYIDLKVNNFDKDVWGSYVDENNITLNFDITNAMIDDEFIEQYAIFHTEDTYTVHVNTPDLKKDTENNYISIKTYLVDDTVSDVYSASQKELDDNNDKIISEKKISVYDTITTSDPTMSGQIIDVFVDDTQTKKKTCVVTSEIMFSDPYVRKTGLNNNSIISFRNLNFKDVINRNYKIRVVVEYGNPMFSRLFFRYFVQNVWIEYKKDDGTVNRFYLGTENLNKTNAVGTYTNTDYMFSTDTHNVFICPISMTAIPEDKYLTEVSGNVSLTGSDKQIELKMDKYTGFVDYSLTEDELLKKYLEEQSIPWEQFKLKKRYMQDNITQMMISPVHINDFHDLISNYELFGASTKYNYSYNDIRTEISNSNYMSVVYHAGLYNSIMRNDEYTFIYNGNVLESERYNQFINESPVYAPAYMNYEIRDDRALKSMKNWNHEFIVSDLSAENLYSGNISGIGNGYNYLDESYDTGQYGKSMMSLIETVNYNDEELFKEAYSLEAPELNDDSKKHPETGYWYRSLLYNLKWQYPQYIVDSETQEQKINAYDIVTGGEYLQGILKNTYHNKLPYNLMYSIYPRCAYNDEDDVSIVFMLRCPSVVRENQYKMEHRDLLLPVEESAYNEYQLSNEQQVS